MNLMVDIETLGTSINSTILAIAAQPFNKKAKGLPFTQTISIHSNLLEDRSIDPDTLKWWGKQDPKLRELMFHGEAGLRETLSEFYLYLLDDDLNFRFDQIWSKSPQFDLAILRHAMKETMGTKTPWQYWQERCVRTRIDLAKEKCLKLKNDMPHDPLSDCLYQIRQIRAVHKALKK